MDRKKKIILGVAAAAGIIYFATRKKSTGTTNASKNANSFRLTDITDQSGFWKQGVGIQPFKQELGWGNTQQFLVEKSGNEDLLTKIKPGTRLKLNNGKILTVEYITDMKIDQWLRIGLTEVVSGLADVAGFPNYITIL